jgi:hypothetical protein
MPSNVAPVQSGSRVAVGFSVHSGWAALVGLTLNKRQPQVLTRTRLELVETFTYKFRQPFHTAEKMPLDQARAFISDVEDEAKRLAQGAIQSVQLELRKKGYELAHYALILASARPLPSLDRILASHALIHTADGELFRDALAYAAERCDLARFTVKQRELLDSGCKTLRLTPDTLALRLAALGKPIGSPWTQDEKFASLAAWLALT